MNKARAACAAAPVSSWGYEGVRVQGHAVDSGLDRGGQVNHTVGYLDLSGPNTKSLRRPDFEAQEERAVVPMPVCVPHETDHPGQPALRASAVDRSFVHSFTAPVLCDCETQHPYSHA